MTESLTLDIVHLRFHELLSVGLIIVIGLLGGKVAQRVRAPQIVGYLLAGLAIGPSGLHLLTHEMLGNLSILYEVALGLILFRLGGELGAARLRNIGREVWRTVAGVYLITLALVMLACRAVQAPWGLALLLGGIATATSPSATLLVVEEYRTRGPLTDRLLLFVAMNSVVAIVVLKYILGCLRLLHGGSVWWQVILLPLLELAVALGIGAVAGTLLSWAEQFFSNLNELLLVTIALILLGTGAALTFHVSPLLVALIMGACTVNFSPLHQLIYPEIESLEQPFYIAFFVLSGASLHTELLASVGVLGIVYGLSRAAGRLLGAHIMTRRVAAPPPARRHLGLALLPHAGLAIGLTLAAADVMPAYAQIITPVVLASVLVFELFGPLATKLTLKLSGEISTAPRGPH